MDTCNNRFVNTAGDFGILEEHDFQSDQEDSEDTYKDGIPDGDEKSSATPI